MDTPSREHETLLTPAEVAALFRVDPKTVTRWARSGKLSAIRTLGGHRRFLESEVLALMGVPGPRAGSEADATSHSTASRQARPHGSATSRGTGTRTGSQGSGPRRAAGA
ncbi:MAG: BldC family transcriptional regulator [Actinomycetales bacterium]|nr:BldC family transcriptional regulator [Actinomycetales bacterium]